jgi:hypothetical protein
MPGAGTRTREGEGRFTSSSFPTAKRGAGVQATLRVRPLCRVSGGFLRETVAASGQAWRQRILAAKSVGAPTPTQQPDPIPTPVGPVTLACPTCSGKLRAAIGVCLPLRRSWPK